MASFYITCKGLLIPEEKQREHLEINRRISEIDAAIEIFKEDIIGLAKNPEFAGMKRSQYFDYIEERLNILSERTRSRGKLNLLDLNNHR